MCCVLCCAVLFVLPPQKNKQAKQGSELVGRSMYLRLTGAGRVDRHTVSDGGSGDASTSASQATRIVLMGESL